MVAIQSARRVRVHSGVNSASYGNAETGRYRTSCRIMTFGLGWLVVGSVVESRFLLDGNTAMGRRGLGVCKATGAGG